MTAIKDTQKKFFYCTHS